MFNHWHYTAAALASIFKSTYPKEKYEIIIVDNASTDMTPKLLSYLQEQGEPIRVIRNEKNLDYLLGANQGWKEAKTPYCLHMNNDVTVDKECIDLLLKPFSLDSSIGAVGAVQYFPDGTRNKPLGWVWRGEEHHKKNIFYAKDVGYYVAYPDKKVGESYTTHILNENVDFVESELIGFGCAVVKREVWEKIGYYDVAFAPSMYEEDDYCLRMAEADYKVVVAPKATCTHHVAVTTSRNQPYYQHIINRNRKLFVKKWGEKLRKKI